MHDANDFVRAIQQVSNGVNEAGYPADVMSGTVIAAAPLKIKVEQRFDIASAQLIIPEHLTDRTVDIELDGVKKEMKKLGFFFTDSMSNFLFAGHENVPAGELFRALKENDIYVRYWNKDRISNRLRITIGTDEQMDRFLEFLRSYLNN